MKIFVTFGQDHYHEVEHKVFDKDTICVIEAEDHAKGREIAFKHFGDKFFTTYEEDEWQEEMTTYFPKGFIYLN